MTRKRLIKLATDAGLYVSDRGTGIVYIAQRKPPRTLFYTGRGPVSVILWPNGSITRGDVRLDLAGRMTLKDAAKALGL